ncbi:MAG: hypothetical protein PHW54_03525 [Candidatus Omnitrophica bacterium]|nr:hypothetical protein [Candidatus Omnitrophota bacterium]
MSDTLKKSIKLTILLFLAAALVLLLMDKPRFALGLVVSSAWSIINFVLLIKILEIAILHRNKEKLTLILLVKFPLLYLAGFFILTSKFFPAYSLVLGLGSILLIAGGNAIWPKHT